MRLRWTQVPRLAAVDIADAWQFGHEDPEAREAIRAVFGHQSVVTSMGLGLGCAVIASYLETPVPGDWFTWGQVGFATVLGRRGWTALQKSLAPDQIIRPLLVTALPGVSTLILAQLVLAVMGNPEAWMAEGVVVDGLISVLGQLCWSLVLLGALTSSQRWLSTLIDLFTAWVVFYLSVGVARMLVEMVGDVMLGLADTVLGWLGLGFLASVLYLVDDVADVGFVVGVLAWVTSAAWLTACEVLPRRVTGEPVSFLNSLKELLHTTR